MEVFRQIRGSAFHYYVVYEGSTVHWFPEITWQYRFVTEPRGQLLTHGIWPSALTELRAVVAPDLFSQMEAFYRNWQEPLGAMGSQDNSRQFSPDIDLSTPFGAQFRFRKSATDTNGEYEELEGLQLAHSDGPPLHMHPLQDETFSITSGTLDVFMDSAWREVKAGETTTVPKGKPHTLKNSHGDDVRCVVTLTPAGDFQGMMRTFDNLVEAGKLRSTKDLRSLIHMSMVFQEHRNDVIILRPPAIVIGALAAVGRALRFHLV